MSQLITMFCGIDDVCKGFEPLYEPSLLASAHKPRRRPTTLSLSEIMTLVVDFHASHDRHFKASYCLHACVHLRPYFPHLVSDHRFVNLMPRALVPLMVYLQTRLAQPTGIAFIDSTPLAVCHLRRLRSHKVFEGLAALGKPSMGWFYGFKLHLIVNDHGEWLACQLTSGHVDDRHPLRQLSQGLVGRLFGDKGYLSKSLHDDLLAQGLEL